MTPLTPAQAETRHCGMTQVTLLTTGAAAQHLGVSVKTVQRWAKAGRLAHVVAPSGRFRFRQTDLDAAMRDRPASAA